MIIAQISDTHIALDTPDAARRLRDLEATVADINALDPAPDVIVHTGDVVHNGREDEYATAVTALDKAHATVHILVGNKDDRAKMQAAFSAKSCLLPSSGFVTYPVDDYPVRLIALDTLCPGNNKGDFCQERAEKLIEMIDAETTKPIAVFAHHPPFEVPVGPDPINFEDPKAMSRLRRTLQYSGRVVAVFSGHVHRGTAGDIDGIPATVVPAIATTLRKGDYPTDMATRPVYHLHRFDPARGFSTESRIVKTRL